MRVIFLIGLTLTLSSLGYVAFAQSTALSLGDLAPQNDYSAPTDSERLQNYQPPPPIEPSYPRLEDQGSGTRLYLDQDHSLGGGAVEGGAYGDYQFPVGGNNW